MVSAESAFVAQSMQMYVWLNRQCIVMRDPSWPWARVVDVRGIEYQAPCSYTDRTGTQLGSAAFVT
jgi:hypothetical protein